MSQSSTGYSSSAIKVLSDIEHIRTRYGMYIGEVDNPKHLFAEAVDNGFDETQSGFSEKVIVSIDSKTHTYKVQDFGRGIPHGEVEVKDDEGNVLRTGEVVEILTTKANSGGKFDNGSYKLRSGLNGVGLTVLNALSDMLIIETTRDGQTVRLETHQGKKVSLTKTEADPELHGTTVTFRGDPEIFDSLEIPYDLIATRCKVAHSLGYTAELYLDGEAQDIGTGQWEELLPQNGQGISTFVDIPLEVIMENGEQVKSVVRYTSDTRESYRGYTNLLYNSGGGTHIREFTRAIKEAWDPYRQGTIIKPNDVLIGVRGMVAVFIQDPNFSSQTKERLAVKSKQIEHLFDRVKDELSKYLKENEEIRKGLLKRFEEYRMAQDKMMAQKEIKEIVKINDSTDGKNIRRKSIVSGLRECQSTSREDTELYIVEGESAGGCFTADTRIKLADGRDLPIKDVVEEHRKGIQNFVYTSTDDGDIKVVPIAGGDLTIRNAELVQVTLDNGEVIRCTPDHPFKLRDGSYKDAKDLTPEDSLMPMYSKKSSAPHFFREYSGKGPAYEFIKLNNSDKWVPVHQMVANMYLGPRPSGTHTHHMDFNSLNNNPDNLNYEDSSWHRSMHAKKLWSNPQFRELKSKQVREQMKGDTRLAELHRERMKSDPEYREQVTLRVTSYWEDPENRKKQSEVITEYFKDNPEARERLSEISKEQWEDLELRRWRSELTSQQMRDPEVQSKRQATMKFRRIERGLKLCSDIKSEGLEVTAKEYNSKRVKKNQPKWSTLIKEIGGEDRLFEELETYNHRVVSVEFLNYREDVYDITVPPYHNFLLSAGVFVHNTAIFARDKYTQAILPLSGKILNVTKKTIKRALKSEEVRNIVNAVGCGVGADSDADRSRYERAIIMCFTGDTRVKLLNGTTPTFEELVTMEQENPGQDYWVYSRNKEGELVPGRGFKPRVTGYRKELVELEFDNGHKVKCTPDHRFMLKDGSWKEAKDLTEDDSLSSVYTKIGNYHEGDNLIFHDRELLYDDSKSKWVPTHRGYFESYEQFVESSLNYTHKIVSKRWVKLEKPIPVYCMTVEDHHNFCLDLGDKTGVVVSNCDADPDGANIAALVLSVFINITPDMVRQTRVYIALPPLFGYRLHKKTGKVVEPDDVENGIFHPAYTLDELPEEVRSARKFTRFKGLGEMDEDELRISCMSEDTRKLIPIEFPTDPDDFNEVLSSAKRRFRMLQEAGVIKSLRDGDILEVSEDEDGEEGEED